MLTARRRRGWWRDRTGSAVVEFAIMAPILLTLLLAAFDVGPSLMVRFKAASATQTVADLITQSATVQVVDVANAFGAGSDVLAPFSGTPLLLRISNIATDGQGRTFVYWSCGTGALQPYTATATVQSTPAGLLQVNPATSGNFTLNGANTSFVVVESSYIYSAPAGFVFPTPQTLTNTAYSLPRVSTYIGPWNGDPNYVPPAPTQIHNNFGISLNGVTCNVGY